ncbi:MAG: hypothetical protein RL756_1140, partial [Pseudomonadota bacterium]
KRLRVTHPGNEPKTGGLEPAAVRERAAEQKQSGQGGERRDVEQTRKTSERLPNRRRVRPQKDWQREDEQGEQLFRPQPLTNPRAGSH